ncbi:Aste57867_15008 [Aphanomyces stellatus]|uniref:Aste57867_15008 protein n=1 Tax=Aphanomyces stellatus TaxID=120398 RepID=A0A485L258_9STRA|nr:hypothetical protein As57867_014952 [Aphanomyces stellatus]VFT91822.1 Aste57867_15008 [Aphanomyces stellatus]
MHPSASHIDGLQEKLNAVRALQSQLHVVALPSHWAMRPAASKIVAAVAPESANIYPRGGFLVLGGMEHVVVDFLDIPGLLAGALVCKRWLDLCRHHAFWEKSLVTPVERHSLRHLLSCPASVPAMHVYMLFRHSGLLPSLSPLSIASIHVTSTFDAKVSLRKWMLDRPALHEETLRSFVFQLVHGCAALERAGLKHRDVATQHVAVVTTTDEDETRRSTNQDPDDTTSIPVLQLMTSERMLEPAGVSPRYFFEERDEALYLLMYRGLAPHKQSWRNTMCGLLYSILELALHGKLPLPLFAQLQYHTQSILHVVRLYDHLLPRDLVSLIEYGAYLRYHHASVGAMLDHSYFDNTNNINPVVVGPMHGQSTTGYMQAILALWQPSSMPRRPRWYVASPVAVNQDVADRIMASSSARSWMRHRWHSVAVPAHTTRAWLGLLVLTQKSTLVRLDLSAASRVAPATLVEILALLPMLREVKLPPAMLRHASFEHVLAALRDTRVAVVDAAFAHALVALERAYDAQLAMVRYAIEKDDDDDMVDE